MCFLFVFRQKTAYEMRISDWSSDVCSSDLGTVTTSRSPSRSPRMDSRPDRSGRSASPRATSTWSAHGCGTQGVDVGSPPLLDRTWPGQLGRAACRERVCQDVLIPGGAGLLNKKKTLDVR